MRSVRRTPVVALLLATFLTAHLTCLCTGPARATAMTIGDGLTARSPSTDPHACCHRSGADPAAHRETSGCQHCTNAQLTAPETLKLAGSTAGTLPMVVAIATTSLTPLAARRYLTRAGLGHAPPPTHHRTTVLLL